MMAVLMMAIKAAGRLFIITGRSIVDAFEITRHQLICSAHVQPGYKTC